MATIQPDELVTELLIAFMALGWAIWFQRSDTRWIVTGRHAKYGHATMTADGATLAEALVSIGGVL